MSERQLARFDPFQAVRTVDALARVFPPSEEEGSDTSAPNARDEDLFSPVAAPSREWMEESDTEANPAPEMNTLSWGSQQNDYQPIRIPQAAHPTSRFLPLQKWEGSVIQITNDSFIARLVDLNNEGPDEEAEIPIEEIPDADRALVELGAIFYWNIGYLEQLNGNRIRASVIRFRRLPAWTTEELETAKRQAELTRDLLDWK